MSDHRTDEQLQAYARALLEEKEGYARAGRTDRVKQVEDELARLGLGQPAAEKRPRGAGKQTRTTT